MSEQAEVLKATIEAIDALGLEPEVKEILIAIRAEVYDAGHAAGAAVERARVKALIEKLRDDWEDDDARQPASYERDCSDKDKAKACDVILDRIEAGAATEPSDG